MKVLIGMFSICSRNWFRISAVAALFLLLLFVPSCDESDEELSLKKAQQEALAALLSESSADSSISEMAVLFGHEKFIRGKGTPIVEEVTFDNPKIGCFDGNFVLKIKNGDDKKTRVSSAEVIIDGEMVVSPSDFSKNEVFISKNITGLTSESVMKVKLNSAPGSFIDLWIEGTLILYIPEFEQIGPLCQNSEAPVLPLVSSNESPISGTWNPATISTATVGKSVYTFTPNPDQCGTPVTMEIEIIPPVMPVFNQIGPLLQGSVPPKLPATSENGITGTWSPDTINTTVVDTIRFTFTPSAGQCASIATMDIIITNKGTVTDIDGKTYATIKIGDQWWMSENLKTTKYKNGDVIGTTATATADISSEATPKYQWSYNGEETNVAKNGLLYTWFAVTDSRGLCPTGWRVPSDADWTTLENYLVSKNFGFEGSGPDIAKSLASISGWTTNATPGNVGNDQATNNSSGFTAMPGGDRKPNGTFELLGSGASFWSFTENNTANGWSRSLGSDQSSLTKGQTGKAYGMSVRCIKD